jgi:CII-binding regulator of phage lambda lysogenization HflD
MARNFSINGNIGKDFNYAEGNLSISSGTSSSPKIENDDIEILMTSFKEELQKRDMELSNLAQSIMSLSNNQQTVDEQLIIDSINNSISNINKDESMATLVGKVAKKLSEIGIDYLKKYI